MSEIIRKIADLEDEGSVCKSTEEMLYKFDQFNKRRNAVSPKMRKLIIGSMDIEKWYPNTIPKPTAKKINHMYVKSKLQIKNMKYDKLARYLGKVLTREEILQEKMEEILYIKEGKMEEKQKYKKKKQSLDIIGGGGKTLNTAEVNDGGGYQNKNKNKIKEKRKYKKKKQSLDIIGGGGKTLNTEQANNGGGYENTKKNMNRKRAVTKKVNKVNKRIEKKNEIKKKKEIFEPKREANDEEKRRMEGKAIEVLIIATTTNHVYKFGDTLRVQAKGGPIGLRCTGEMAECYMVDWDKRLKIELKKYGIELDIFSRFKDDINIVTESLEKGSKLFDGNIIIDEAKKKLDEEKSDSCITMEIIKEIAESIDPMIRLTVDTPCKHKGNYIPILDLKVSMNTKENNRIDYQFFEKPTNNKRGLLANAAMSAKSMRTILTQEGLRRLRNTSLHLGKEVQEKHLNDFMLKLKNSGHSVKFRKQILDSILKAFDKILLEDKKGTKPLFRDRNWNLEEREESKKRKKLNWFNNYKNEVPPKSEIIYKSVLFVPPTPGGELARELKHRKKN